MMWSNFMSWIVFLCSSAILCSIGLDGLGSARPESVSVFCYMMLCMCMHDVSVDDYAHCGQDV